MTNASANLHDAELTGRQCALFPLPEGEGQVERPDSFGSEGKRREILSRVSGIPRTVELDESSGGAGRFLKQL